jgi:hypothetical protein
MPTAASAASAAVTAYPIAATTAAAGASQQLHKRRCVREHYLADARCPSCFTATAAAAAEPTTAEPAAAKSDAAKPDAAAGANWELRERACGDAAC